MQEAAQLLTPNELAAVRHLRNELAEITEVLSVIVFGSVARGEATADSDLDLLAVTSRELSYAEETAAYDAVYRTNLQYDTNISIVVVDAARWESPLWSKLPLYQAVQQEGMLLQ